MLLMSHMHTNTHTRARARAHTHKHMHTRAHLSLQMTGMSVVPVEDEECEFTTMQQVAAARYQRNHRLMAEIFNDIVIPVVKPSTYPYLSIAWMQ